MLYNKIPLLFLYKTQQYFKTKSKSKSEPAGTSARPRTRSAGRLRKYAKRWTDFFKKNCLFRQKKKSFPFEIHSKGVKLIFLLGHTKIMGVLKGPVATNVLITSIKMLKHLQIAVPAFNKDFLILNNFEIFFTLISQSRSPFFFCL